MKIKVNFTRDENIEYYGSDSAEIDLETYVWGVCASECGGSTLEAQKALAVAARTNGYYKNKKDGAISDSSAKAQAFRASRLTDAYKISRQAAQETSNLILYCNGKIAEPCAFSSNNGGRTASSQSRWGGYRSFLIEQDDPYDNASKVTGHRIGLSQLGANNRSKAGHNFKQILNFYYPTTYLHNLSTNENTYFDEKEEGEEKMSTVATAKASQLIPIFKQAVDEHWSYVAGGRSKGSVDCSGLFYYAYNKLGSYMYQGSNTIYRKYTVKKGKKADMEVVPGMAVFVNKKDGKEPSQYCGDGIGNMSHIGMYVGNGLVAEAKGTLSGCVYSSLSDSKWTHVAELKYTDYDVKEGSSTFTPFTGQVTTASGSLNLRNAPQGTKIGSIPKGTILEITGQSNDWYKTSYNGLNGYVSSQYITKIEPIVEKTYIATLYPIPESKVNMIKEYATSLGVSCSIEGAS